MGRVKAELIWCASLRVRLLWLLEVRIGRDEEEECSGVGTIGLGSVLMAIVPVGSRVKRILLGWEAGAPSE